MPGTMPGMANRKGQQQPMRRGTGRQPGAPLSAALAGRAAPGLASGVMEQQRQLAKNAGKLSDALGGAAPGGNRKIPTPPANAGPKPVNSLAGDLLKRSAVVPAKGVTRPLGPAKGRGVAEGQAPAEPMAPGKTRSLARDLQQGKDRAPVKGSPQLRDRAYLNGGQTRKNAAGEDFREFTIDGKQGVYHEYVDPKTGKRKVRRVAGAVQTA